MSKSTSLHWKQSLIFISVVLFILSGCFMHGLFFNKEYLLAAFIAFGVVSIFFYKIEFPRDAVFYLLLANAGIYAYGVVYAENSNEALMEAIKAMFLISLYLIFGQLTIKQFRGILQVLLGSTFASTIFGILAGRFYDGRLAGLLDYANAYALLLLACIIVSQVLYATNRHWIYLVYQFTFVTALVLTQSRTVLLLLIAVQIVLYFTVGRKRLDAWLRTLICACIGLLGAALFEMSAWYFLPVIAFVSAFMVYEKKATNKSLLFVLLSAGGATIIAFGGLLFKGGLTRWLAFGTSATEWQSRLVYYHDALKMSRKSILFGYGGGGWSQLQCEFQTSDYYVRYVHNHFLQVLTDVGLVGMLIYASIIVTLLFRSVKELRRSTEEQRIIQWGKKCVCFVFIAHSLVDFAWSYPFLLGIFLLMSMKIPSMKENGAVHRRGRIWIYGIVVTASIIGMTVSGISMLSVYQYDHAMESLSRDKPADAVRNLERSIKWGLFPDQAYDQKAKIYYRGYLQDGDHRYLSVAEEENRKAIVVNSSNIWYRKLQSDILWEQGSHEQSILILEEIIQKNRFEDRWRDELKKRNRLAKTGLPE